jgi:cell shape-determining protein MreC
MSNLATPTQVIQSLVLKLGFELQNAMRTRDELMAALNQTLQSQDLEIRQLRKEITDLQAKLDKITSVRDASKPAEKAEEAT